jgi:hypothetical protein
MHVLNVIKMKEYCAAKIALRHAFIVFQSGELNDEKRKSIKKHLKEARRNVDLSIGVFVNR